MSRQLSSLSDLDTLKKEAKRWLKALRAGDAKAQARLRDAYAKAPSAPTLRDVQHALALEYGFADWAALKQTLADRKMTRLSRDARADILLRHVWGGDVGAAGRLLQHDPTLAHHSLYTAVICDDIAEVERRLTDNPASASTKGGPLNWEPLLYLAYARLPQQAASGQAVAIARLLLDRGADPAARFTDDWENPFTVLTGIIGAGEGGQPPHPEAVALATLLIARGADPYDTQALYNTSLMGDDPTWLDFLYAQAEMHGVAARWHAVPPVPFGGVVPLSMLDYLLGNAVIQNHIRRSDWLLTQGAHADSVHAYSGQKLHTETRLRGLTAMADLLIRHGAQPESLEGMAAFQAACMEGDRAAALVLADADPSYLLDAAPMIAAIESGRADLVNLLVDIGMSSNVPDKEGVRPLNKAVLANQPAMAQLLIERGAEIDFREPKHGGSPLDWAVHLGRPALVDLLVPQSRDVFALASAGGLARLGDILAADPQRALERANLSGATPLFCLPDHEDQAVEIARLLLRHKVDPRATDRNGATAEQIARQRGLEEAADLIRASG
nr:ankyrin repeat domain-containing protein [uncultured Dongia sp.]